MYWWFGLCSLPVSCLALGDPALRSTGSMVRLMATSKRTYTTGQLPGVLLPGLLSIWWATVDPRPTGDPPTLAGRSSSVSCGDTAPGLSLGLGTLKVLLALSNNGVSVSPRPMEVLQSNSTQILGQIPWDFLFPLPDPQAEKPDVGLWTFTTVGELLW